MPNSIHVQLADAVLAELNSGSRSWTGSFTAVRRWKVWWDHDDLESLQVAVVPLEIETERIARGSSKMRYVYGVAIDMQRQENVNASDLETRIDALDKLAQDVADFYQDGHDIITGYPVLIAERPETYSPELLQAEGTWETLIMLGIVGLR